MTTKSKILVVDDELFNLDILRDYLTEQNYEVIEAENGLVAMEQIASNPDLDLILLDRMMPNMNGMEVLERIKADELTKSIPVIMQTASARNEQIYEGIKAGVYYYLTKPYEEELLLNIVKAALLEATNKKEMLEELYINKRVLGMMEQARFCFCTLSEAKNLAYFIAHYFPSPESVVYGLSELFINAIEHGNLGIGYELKTELILSGTWEKEIMRRLSLQEHREKKVLMSFEYLDDAIEVTIKDQGEGFDFSKYLEMSPERMLDIHGRGIALAKMFSFTSLEYIGCGNEVRCRVELHNRAEPFLKM